MGGQIMPPVMGAVAFIMAENLNVPYAEIVKAAAIPAILYYLTAFWMVHLEAGRKNLHGLPKAECPNPWRAMRDNWYLLLPLAVLVWMLFNGFTPMFAGMVGLALTAILILGAAIAARISARPSAIVFWVALGLGAAAFVKNMETWGIYPLLALIAALVAQTFAIKGGTRPCTCCDEPGRWRAPGAAGGRRLRHRRRHHRRADADRAASSFAGFILSVGEKSLFLSLVLTMLVCLVLGMGIPTIPNYIITSSIAAPALLKLGVPLIVSHMFVFYFGIMADLTPPVALAAFAASPIAKESAMKIGFKAVQVAIAGFVMPYMAVYDPR
jgi:TRAP-type uncharacterized transport system fused permease subunit